MLTANHPWLGAWSSASRSVDESINNLGPLQLDLLAPFTKVDPYAGTAVGVGLVATCAVFTVWWSARRTLGDGGAAAAMFATVVLEAAIGSQAFIDPRQQVYLLLPYWALLWLTFAVAMGDGASVVPLIFTASLILQTHLSYLYQTVLLVVVGLASYIVIAWFRRPRGRALRPLLTGLLVGLLCWAQPLWDQFAGEGNLAAVFGSRGEGARIGWNGSVEVIATSVLLPPRFWLPGSMWNLSSLPDFATTRTSWIALLAWMLILFASTIAAWRSGRRNVAALGGAAIVTLVAAIVAGGGDPEKRVRDNPPELLLDVADRCLHLRRWGVQRSRANRRGAPVVSIGCRHDCRLRSGTGSDTRRVENR